jgi:hypothetical protein
MDRYAHQAISAGIYNHLLFIDIDAFREKTHVHVKFQVMVSSSSRPRHDASFMAWYLT